MAAYELETMVSDGVWLDSQYATVTGRIRGQHGVESPKLVLKYMRWLH